MPEAERHQRMLLSSRKIGIALYRASAIRVLSPFNADWDLVPDLRDFVAAIRPSSCEVATPSPTPEPSEPQQPTDDQPAA